MGRTTWFCWPFTAGVLVTVVQFVVANAQSSGPVLYRLNPDSSFQRGCFPPCMCAVMITEPVKGTFILTPSGSDPLFNTYTVTEVHWSFTNNRTVTVVTGGVNY